MRRHTTPWTKKTLVLTNWQQQLQHAHGARSNTISNLKIMRNLPLFEKLQHRLHHPHDLTMKWLNGHAKENNGL